MGTFGSMQMPDGIEIFTVEDAWRENQQNISCIPLGSYQCSPRFYNRGGYPAIRVENVENRSYILIHRGNTEVDVEGCIVTGTKLGFINNRWAVANSRAAFDIVVQHFGNKRFELQIEHFDPSENSYLNSRSGSLASIQSSVSTELLRQHGVVTQSMPNEEFEYVDSIKGRNTGETNSGSTLDFDSVKSRLSDLGVNWYDGLGYLEKPNSNSYWFFSSAIDVQRGANNEPMCSLMPMGDTGFLNLATVLSPPAETVEKLRKKLERNSDSDQENLILSELNLRVTKARLLLDDRSGTKSALAQASSSGTSPHSAMFVTQLNAQDFPLVNSGLAGESNLLTVEYEVVLEFPSLVKASLSAETHELIEEMNERNLWQDSWDTEMATSLVEELIDAEKIELTFLSEGTNEDHRKQLKDELVELLISWLAEQVQAESGEPEDVDEESFSELISLERSLEIIDPVELKMTTDAAEWNVTAIKFRR